MMPISDPRTIPQKDLPLFVSKSSTIDLVSFLIQWRTGGDWNHSMGVRTAGKFYWQGLQIEEQPMGLYLVKGTRMDFFSLNEINPRAIIAMNSYLDTRMAGHWWGQTYDFLGILGQAIGIPALHTPGLDYCSVLELAVLRAMSPYLGSASQKVINAQLSESNPQNLHDMYVGNPDVFTLYGQYESDEGVTT